MPGRKRIGPASSVGVPLTEPAASAPAGPRRQPADRSCRRRRGRGRAPRSGGHARLRLGDEHPHAGDRRRAELGARVVVAEDLVVRPAVLRIPERAVWLMPTPCPQPRPLTRNVVAVTAAAVVGEGARTAAGAETASARPRPVRTRSIRRMATQSRLAEQPGTQGFLPNLDSRERPLRCVFVAGQTGTSSW